MLHRLDSTVSDKRQWIHVLACVTRLFFHGSYPLYNLNTTT
jgi:hypothetical protein